MYVKSETVSKFVIYFPFFIQYQSIMGSEDWAQQTGLVWYLLPLVQ